MSRGWPWKELGLNGKAPLREVKRAYARRLKEIDRADPDAFQALRHAFEAAKSMANPAEDQARPDLRTLASADPLATAPEAPTQNPQQAGAATGAEGSDLPDTETEPQAPSQDQNLEAFWAAVDEAINSKQHLPFDAEKMDTLLQAPAAQDRDVRHEVETMLYLALDAHIGPKLKPVPRDAAALVETHFGWLTDGQALRRLAGLSERGKDIAHVLTQAQGPGKIRRIWQNLSAAYLPQKAALTLAVTLFATRYDESAFDPSYVLIFFPIFFLALSLLALALHSVLTVLSATLQLLRIQPLLLAGAARIAPQASRRLKESQAARRFACFILAALALGALNL